MRSIAREKSDLLTFQKYICIFPFSLLIFIFSFVFFLLLVDVLIVCLFAFRTRAKKLDRVLKKR